MSTKGCFDVALRQAEENAKDLLDKVQAIRITPELGVIREAQVVLQRLGHDISQLEMCEKQIRFKRAEVNKGRIT